MLLELKMLREEDNVHIDLKEGKFYIKDTISDWLIVNSKDLTVAVFDKFSTVSIVLKEKR